MTFDTIDDLRVSLAQPALADPRYRAKMLHPLPVAPVVDRIPALVAACIGQRVLDLGASGELSTRLRAVARGYTGIDKAAGTDILGCDLDALSTSPLPQVPCDIIVCAEVLEHLSNPGMLLTRIGMQYPTIPLVITVPNAYSSIAARAVRDGQENVNIDHVAWYSPRTLRTLLERAGYVVTQWQWYHGAPGTAEGLIAHARTMVVP